MLQHFTSETHVSLRMVEDPGQLRDPADLVCDGILIDVQNIAPEEAARVVGRARADLPVVTVGPSLSPELGGLFGSERTLTFVRKPMVQEAMLAALAECLLSTEREERRSEGPRPVSPALKAQLLERIARRTESLRARLAATDPMGCYSICQEIRSLAEHAGAWAPARAADAAAARLATTMNATESLQEIGDLIRACESIDAKRLSA
jgi:hypothetical protein